MQYMYHVILDCITTAPDSISCNQQTLPNDDLLLVHSRDDTVSCSHSLSHHIFRTHILNDQQITCMPHISSVFIYKNYRAVSTTLDPCHSQHFKFNGYQVLLQFCFNDDLLLVHSRDDTVSCSHSLSHHIFRTHILNDQQITCMPHISSVFIYKNYRAVSTTLDPCHSQHFKFNGYQVLLQFCFWWSDCNNFAY